MVLVVRRCAAGTAKDPGQGYTGLRVAPPKWPQVATHINAYQVSYKTTLFYSYCGTHNGNLYKLTHMLFLAGRSRTCDLRPDHACGCCKGVEFGTASTLKAHISAIHLKIKRSRGAK